MDFTDELAYALLTNGLLDQERPTRISERVALGDADDLLNARSMTHLLQQFPKQVSGKRSQHRCRYCLVKEGVENWTTFYCSKCSVALCGVTNRGGRECFALHLTCGVEDLRPATFHIRASKCPRLE